MALEGTIRTDPKAALRDRAIVVMLGGTGARGAELFADPKDEKRPGLRWSDVDFEKADDRSVWQVPRVRGSALPRECPQCSRALVQLSRATD